MTKYVDRAELIATDTEYEFLNREGLDHKIIKDEHGTFRWEADPVIEMLFDNEVVDLQELVHKLIRKDKKFKNNKTFRELYRRMGYSIFGYWEVFHWEANNEDADEYQED